MFYSFRHLVQIDMQKIGFYANWIERILLLNWSSFGWISSVRCWHYWGDFGQFWKLCFQPTFFEKRRKTQQSCITSDFQMVSFRKRRALVCASVAHVFVFLCTCTCYLCVSVFVARATSSSKPWINGFRTVSSKWSGGLWCFIDVT